jgi:hypothetical protein
MNGDAQTRQSSETHLLTALQVAEKLSTGGQSFETLAFARSSG